MSVAFRRESDDEHLEPRFELPIPPGPNLVTARGLRLIEDRVKALEAALQAAADEEAGKAIARDLRYWRTRHATADVAAPMAGDTVAFGRQVRIKMNGRIRTLKIVGHDEADPANDRIGFAAPLARALMDSAAGDRIAFAGREDAIEVIEVRDLPDEDM